MNRRTNAASAALCVLALAASARSVSAQSRAEGDPANSGYRGTVAVSPGLEYQGRSGLWRLLFGNNWRKVWEQSIEVPVLDLSTYAGGLTAYKKGGNQTRTLHFKGADGRHYVFRSVAKSVQVYLGPDLQHTFVGGVIQDQNSANHPSSATIADIVQDAAGVLHPSPTLVVLPDDGALGEFRKEYASMLGHIEIKPDDVPDGVEQFGHADKIQDADKLLLNLDASLEYRFDARAYLKTRLVDAIMGDFDRGADQWDFVRHDRDGVKTYAPIARDRDWAFMRSNGLLMKRVRAIYAKIGSYDVENEDVRSITFMTHEFDRSHLVALPWSEWEAVVHEIETAVTDAVVDAAVTTQPSAYTAHSAKAIELGLEARRDHLASLAWEFYLMVNEQADIFAADGNEQADIEMKPDGSIRVRLLRVKKDGSLATDEGTAIDRTFLPSETKEVRVYMQEGDDHVVVRGTGPGHIKLRVTGGAGNDALIDSTSNASRIEFYDASGTNLIVAGRGTNVHTGSFTTAQPSTLDPEPSDTPKARIVLEERRGRFQDQWRIKGADFTKQRTQSEATRFWGETTSLMPAFDLRDGAGLIVGGAMSNTQYGFRSEPFHRMIGGRLLYAAGAGRFGADFTAISHPANSHYSMDLYVRASGFESQRFYGLGNNSVFSREDSSLIMRNEFLVQPSVQLHLGKRADLVFGPAAQYVDPQTAGGPIAEAVLGDAYSAVGAQVALRFDHADDKSLPHRGFRGSVEAATFQALTDGDGGFAKAGGTLSAYIPLSKPTLALRAGGEKLFGDFPLHEAAMIGGRPTVRGYMWQRFTGDASAFGTAELRVPVLRAELLVRGDVGLILLADAGRVWVDGESPGGWHTSKGAGLSFSSMSQAVSLVFARGEDNRIYLNFGLPF
ncbi:MAG: BamA/TamA family outer membrane protein [Longimicrobiales bacterium]